MKLLVSGAEGYEFIKCKCILSITEALDSSWLHIQQLHLHLLEIGFQSVKPVSLIKG